MSWGCGVGVAAFQAVKWRSSREGELTEETLQQERSEGRQKGMGDGEGQQEAQEAVKPSEEVNGQLCQMLLLTGHRK